MVEDTDEPLGDLAREGRRVVAVQGHDERQLSPQRESDGVLDAVSVVMMDEPDPVSGRDREESRGNDASLCRRTHHRPWYEPTEAVRRTKREGLRVLEREPCDDDGRMSAAGDERVHELLGQRQPGLHRVEDPDRHPGKVTSRA